MHALPCRRYYTQLYLSFIFPGDKGELESVRAIELCVSDIRSWMVKDKLSMNVEKTVFLIIGTRQQLIKVNISNISIGTEDISEAPVKNLGVWLDRNLSMDATS